MATINGSDNGETLNGTADADVINALGGADTVHAQGGADTVYGGDQRDTLNGGDGNDVLYGEGDKDTLRGDAGNDTLIGGAGQDRLVGGTGSDTFVYLAATDSTMVEQDVIVDFTQGQDLIDLEALLGAADLEWGGATATANGVWYRQISGNTIVYADLTGDASADFRIQVNGLVALTSDDFLGLVGSGPAPADDTASVTEDSVLVATGNVLANDLGGVSSVIAVRFGATDGTVGVALPGDYGTLTLQADGSYVYTLNNAAENVQALVAGQTVQDVFTYTASSADGSAEAALTVSIGGASEGVNAIDGTASGETLNGTSGADLINALGGVDTVNALGGADTVFGGDQRDTLRGGDGEDTLYGEGDKDQLFGDAGNDTLIGGADQDRLRGGAGSDTFRYLSAGDSTVAAQDFILDFVQGEDRIDLSPLLGTTDLAWGATTATPYGAWYRQISGNTFVYVDLDGNATADFRIQVNGLVAFTQTDFLGVEQPGASGPVPTNDTASASEDDVLSAAGNVLGNDAGAGLSVTAVRFGATNGTLGIALTGRYGSLTLNADGTYAYTLDNVAADVQALSSTQSVQDVFTYTVTNAGGSVEATITVTITGANDAPTASDTAVSTNEDQTLNGTLPAAIDLDGDAVTYALGTQAADGAATVDADGSFSYVPDANFNGGDSFTYTVSDGFGGSNTYTVSVTVDPVTDPPSATDDAASLIEDVGPQFASGNVLSNDDAAGGTLVVTTPGDYEGDYGTLSLAADGSYTYALDARVQTLPDGTQVTDSFTYQASNGEGTASAALDINITGTNDVAVIGSTPSGRTLFQASDAAHGAELWATDGTAAGTVLVKDILAGPNGSFPAGFTLLGDGRFLFSAYQEATGTELWITDGTAAGTVLVKDLFGGSGSSDPQELTALGDGRFLFGAQDAFNNHELWVTDGTAAGTVLVKDIFAGPNGSFPTQFKALGDGRFLFSATDEVHGQELWVTDGTAAGTVLLKDIFAGGSGSSPSGFAALGDGRFLFRATDETTGQELWITDGTAAGTVLVKDLVGGSGSSDPQELTALGDGRFLFTAQDAVNGQELWVTDGTAAGTVLLKNIFAGGNGSSPSGFAALGDGRFLFSAQDSANGRELWVTDGTATGTVLLKNIRAGSGSSFPDGFTALGDGRFLFAAQDATNGRELWVTDGTMAGTVLLKAIMAVPNAASPGLIVPLGDGRFVFAAQDATNGRELWVSDATASGTALLKDIFTGSGSSNPQELTVLGDGRVLFRAQNATNNYELWVTDGTTAGTALLKEILAGSNGSSPGEFAALDDGRALFSAFDATTGRELWVTDGTAAGTVLLKDISTGLNSSQPSQFTAMGDGRLLFFAADETHGRELWVTDGTAAGTVLLKDIFAGVNGSWPQEFTALGDGRFLFRAADGTSGEELWVTDGTAAGTVLLKDISTGSNSSQPYLFTAMGDGRFLFSAQDSTNGRELWVTDGTATGTVLLKDIFAGEQGSFPDGFTALSDGRFLFTAQDAASGRELWVTDGTSTGTVLLKDIVAGTSSSVPTGITALGDERFLFSAQDSTNGRELWVTDGTAAGTLLLKDIWTGTGHSSPSGFTALGDGRVVFAARDAIHGEELWITDGTTAGTVLLADVFPGGNPSPGSSPSGFAPLGNGLILFEAGDYAHGREPWITDGTAAGTVMLKDLLAGPEGSGPGDFAAGSAFPTVTEAGGVDNATQSGANSVGGTLTIADPDAGEALFQVPDDLEGTYGTFTFNATGAWTYTLDPLRSNGLRAGDSVFDHLSVSSIDGGATRLIVVRVLGANDAPTIVPTVNVSTNEDTAVGGTATGSDVDAGAVLSYAATDGANGTVTIDADSGAWTYTPAAGFNGDDSFTITVSDQLDAAVTQTVNVSVAAANDMPTITGSDTGSVAEDGTLSATGTLTVTDPDAGESFAQPQTDTAGDYGTFSVDADGNWSYALANASAAVQGLGEGELVSDTFTVTSQDGTATEDVVISVTGANDAPTAAHTSVSTDEDQTLNGNLPAATDVDNDTVTYALGAGATNGTAVVNTDGSFSYTPNTDFNGTDSFTYTVSDGNGGSNTYTVTVNVGGDNDPATIAGDTTGAVAEDGTLTVSGTLTVTDPDAGESFAQPQTDTAGTYGTFSVNAAGEWTYNLTNATANVQALADDASVTDTFTVTSQDGSATQNVVITITGTNDAPTITASVNANTDEDTAVGGTAAGSDVDTGATLSYSATDGANGAVSIDANSGAWTYTPAANFNGGDSFTITVSDGLGGSAQQAVNVTIDAVNDAPTASDTTVATDEDQTLNGNLPAATDADNDTVTYALGAAASNGTAIVNADGSFSYDPNADFNGADSFTYTVSDGNGGSNTYTVTVTVGGANDPATITGDDTGAVAEDGTLTASGTLTVTDPDAGESFAQPQTDTAGTYGTFSINAAGEWSYALTNAAANVQALADGATVTDTFTVTSQDGSASQDVVITVTGANDAPTASDTTVATDEDETLNGNLPAATDVDNDTVTYALATGATSGTAVVNADGSFNYTPDVDYNGTDAFTYSVEDGQGGSNTYTVSVNVAGVNDAPRLTPAVTVFGSTDGVATTAIESGLGIDSVAALAALPDGRLVAAGVGQTAAGGADFAVVRYNADGRLDASFGGDGIVTTAIGPGTEIDAINGLVLLADGGVIAAGLATLTPTGTPRAVSAIVHYNADGSLDAGFDGDGIVTTLIGPAVGGNAARDVLAQPDGKIVVAGDAPGPGPDFMLARYNTNGSLDTTFGGGDGIVTTAIGASADGAQAIARQTDGKLIVAGTTFTLGGGNDFGLARYNDDGTLDTGFGGGDGLVVTPIGAGTGSDVAFDLALVAGGKIVVAGYATTPSGGNDIALVRYNADGTLDTSFGGGDGIVTTAIAIGTGADRAFDLVVQPDGRLILAGVTTTADGGDDIALLRYNTDGTPDTSFGGGDGIVITALSPGDGADAAGAVLLMPDGKLVVGGFAQTADGGRDFAVVRYNADGTLDSSFGDGGMPDQRVGAGQSLSLVLPANLFTDPEGGALEYLIAARPSETLPAWLSYDAPTRTLSGTVPIDATDFFVRIIATDAQGATATDDFRIIIAPPTAIAGDDTGAVAEDGTLTATGTLTVTDPDSGESAAQPQTDTAGTYGTFSVNAAGEWSYALTNAAANVQALAGGATVTDTFTVTSQDGSATQDVVITVTGANDAPTITATVTASTDEDTAVGGTAAGNDVDTGAALTYSATNGTNGTASIDGNSGAWTYTPVENFNGGDSFTITVSDGLGGSAQQTVNVTIDPANDAPTASDTTVATSEDTVLNGNLPAATDLDNDTVTYALGAGAAHGAAVVNGDGSFSYTPNTDFNGADSFTYTVSDGNGGSNTYTVTVNVGDANDPATITGDDTGAVAEDGTLTASGTLTVTDPDAGESFAQPQNDVDGTYGSFSVKATGEWTYTLNNAAANVQALTDGEIVTDTFTVTSQDGTATEDVVITITGAGEDPVDIVWTSTSPLRPDLPPGSAGTEVIANLATIDADQSTGHSYTLVATNTGRLAVSSTGIVTASSPPNPDFFETLTIRTTDANGDTYTESFDIAALVSGTSPTDPRLQGDDILYGRSGSQILYGGDGNDTLFGLSESDTLYGGTGNDVLDGGTGSDSLSGEAGDDRFLFADGFGQDTIVGFTAGGTEDSIDLSRVSNLSWSSFAELQADATQVGADVVIDLGSGNSITLTGVTVGELTAADFVGVAGRPVDIVWTPTDPLLPNLPPGYTGPELIANLSVVDSDQPLGHTYTLIGSTSGRVGVSNTGVVTALSPQDLDRFETYTIRATDASGWTFTESFDVVANNSGLSPADSRLQGDDVIYGRQGPQTLFGGDGNDSLFGLSENDVLSGGVGRDWLAGGFGADRFLFMATATASDSTVAASDVIRDFTPGVDWIDLSALLGATDLQWGATVPAANAVWYSHGEGATYVFADVTGDVVPELRIELDGLHELAATDIFGVQAGATLPLADDDTADLAEDSVLTIEQNVMSNDSGTALTVSSVQFGSTFGIVGTPLAGNYGVLTLAADGEYEYTLDNDSAAVQSLALGETVQEVFSYWISNAGGTSTATLTLTLTGANDTATITGDATGAVAEDGILTATGTLTVSDPDAGESFAQPQTDAAGTYGTFTANAAGEWSYALDNDAANVQALADGEIVTDTFTVTSQDGGTAQDVVITITGAADGTSPPVLTPAALVFGSTSGIARADLSANDTSSDLLVQPDGKIVVAGYALNQFALARFNADGTLDAGFGDGGKVVTPNTGDISAAIAQAVERQPDGKLLLAGAAVVNGVYQLTLLRYEADGALDSTFGDGDGIAVAALPASINATGEASIVVQPDGKAIVLTTLSSGEFGIVRFNVDGSLDANFGVAGVVTTDLGGSTIAYGIVQQADGKLVVAGYGGSGYFAVARFNEDGTPDTAFGTDGLQTTDVAGNGYGDIAYSLTIQADDKIVLVGQGGFATPEGFSDPRIALVRYNPDGSLDLEATTNVPGAGFDEARSIIQQADGKLVVAGYAYTSTGLSDFVLVRYNADLTLDTSFGNGGIVVTNFGPGASTESAFSVVQQADGKLLVTGYAYSNGAAGPDFVVVRYNVDGTLDTTFGDGGMPDQSTTPGAAFSLTIPENLFTDPDGGSVTYTVTTPSGAPLPDWLDYDAPTRTLSGTVPTDAFDFDLRIVATDGDGMNSFDDFRVDINQPATISGDTTGQVSEDSAFGFPTFAFGNLMVTDADSGEAALIGPVNIDGQYGSMSIGTGGEWSYSLSVNSAAVQALAEFETVTDTFTVASYDGTAQQDIEVTVYGSNDTPTIDPFLYASTEEDTPLQGTILASDIDNGTILQYSTGFPPVPSGSEITSAYGGHVSVDQQTGAWTYTPAENFFGSDNFYLFVDDGSLSFDPINGRFAWQLVQVEVSPVEDPSVITGNLSGTVSEDGLFSANGFLGIEDPDGVAPYVSPQSNVQGAYGTFSVDFGGVWTYNLDNDATHVQALSRTDIVSDTFTVYSLDGTAQVDVVVTINGANEPGELSGRVTDGPIVGASVYVDNNADGSVDGGDLLVAVTNASGGFTYDTADNPGGLGLVVVGGIDVDTREANTVVLSAPAGFAQINPITSLIEQVMNARALSEAQAEQFVIDAFGLPALDYATTDIYATSLDAQKIAAILGTAAALTAEEGVSGDPFAYLESQLTGGAGSGLQDITDAVATDAPQASAAFNSTVGGILAASSNAEIAQAQNDHYFNDAPTLTPAVQVFGVTDGVATTNIGPGASDDLPFRIVVQPDGKLVAAGSVTARAGAPNAFALARYNPDGTLDDTFGAGGIVTTPIGSAGDFNEAKDLALQSDGKLIAAGQARMGATRYDFALARYNTDGTLDASFGGGDGIVTTAIGPGTAFDQGWSLVIQPDDRIVVAGQAATTTGGTDFAIVRYNADGTLDATFGGGDGIVTTAIGSGTNPDQAFSVVRQSDGAFVVAGSSITTSGGVDFTLARYDADGVLDPSFGSGGIVTTNFGSGTDAESARYLLQQSDGKLVAAGVALSATFTSDFALARYNSDGTLDTSFGGDGIVTVDVAVGVNSDAAMQVVEQADGKLVVVGRTSSPEGDDDLALLRFNPDGTLDTDFGGDGVVTVNFGPGASFEGGWSVALQPDGQIVVAGHHSSDELIDDFAILRFNADGTLDTTFGDGGMQDQAVVEQEPFALTVPLNLFTDPEGHSLTYSASMSDGSALPVWMSFDPVTRVLSGTPPAAAANLLIRITATDSQGASSSDLFRVLTTSADETFTAGPDPESFTGGPGNDTFMFAGDFGADIITDFTSNEDSINLAAMTNLDWTSFADVQTNMTQSGADTVIDLGNGNTITLVGVTAGNLTAGDFVL